MQQVLVCHHDLRLLDWINQLPPAAEGGNRVDGSKKKNIKSAVCPGGRLTGCDI